MNRRSEQFQEVCSQDFLQFRFGGRGYQDQLNDSIVKTQVLSAIKVRSRCICAYGICFDD